MKGEGDRIVTPRLRDEDRELDLALRPRWLSEFIGQERLKESLRIFIEAAKERKEPLDHVLLCGPPGLGKTTLSIIIANELGAGLKSTSGPAIERKGDLAAILSKLERGDVLFIDEMHRLNHIVEEMLYPAMEEFKLDWVIGKGPGAQSIKISLNRYTLIGATTRQGLVTAPLRSRFGIILYLDLYEDEDMFKIVMRSAGILGIEIEEEAAWEIAKRSRGTPRIANRILKRVRDYAQVRADGRITGDVAREALELLGIDELGLDSMDRKIMMTIMDKFGGGPVGLNTISLAVGEDKETIEDVYEPHLLRIGFIERTPSGRKATRRAYEHFGRIRLAEQSLF
jgi:Holliday junction DNA helicase RuvB